MSAPTKRRQSRQARTPIGRRIKELRQQFGLSQQELGVAIKLDEAVAGIRINQYERSVHTPIYSLIQQLAAFARVPESYFYTLDDELAELIAHFGSLAPAARKKLLAMAADLNPKK